MSAPGRAEEDRPCAIAPAAVTHGADIGPPHAVQVQVMPPPPKAVTRSTAYNRRRSAVNQHRDRAHSRPDSHTGAFAASAGATASASAAPMTPTMTTTVTSTPVARRKPRRRRNAAPNSAPATAGTKSQDAETKRPTNALGTIATRPSTKSAVASISAPKPAAVNDPRELDGSTERPTEMPPATTTRSAQGK